MRRAFPYCRALVLRIGGGGDLFAANAAQLGAGVPPVDHGQRAIRPGLPRPIYNLTNILRRAIGITVESTDFLKGIDDV